jgi:hypothetical protein
MDPRGIPSHFVINEVYRDNKELLLNKYNIIELVRHLVKKISNTEESYNKGFLLESLKILIFFKTRVIVPN